MRGRRGRLPAVFLLATVSQILKLLRVFGPVALLLDLAAVLRLRRGLADLPASGRAPRQASGMPGEYPLPAGSPPPPPAPGESAGAVAWVLALAGVAGALACSRALYRDFTNDLMTVMVAGPLSLAALGIGLDLLTGHGFRFGALRAPLADWWRGPERRPLLLVLLLGALFRFGSLGYFPPPDGISSIEEMQRASGGLMILQGYRPWEFPLAQYLNAASFSLFGLSMHAVRLPATFLAWLTLPVFFALARLLVSPRAALFATALLAVARWHCQLSWYNEDVYLPLFPFTVLLLLLVSTRRSRRPSLYVAAGALCGYFLYDYAAYRGAVLVALLFFAADAAWQRRWPPDWRRIGAMLAVTALFALPLLGVLDEHRGGKVFYVEALERSFADTRYYTDDPLEFVRQRWTRMGQAAGVFSSSDRGHFFATLNVLQAPLLDPFTGVFFSLGLGVTLLQLRRRYHAFFALAFLLLATGAMVVTWNLDFRRLAVLVPFVFLFVAFLADDIGALASSADGAGRSHSWMIAVGLLAALCNGIFLFGLLARDPMLRLAHRTPYTVPADYLLHHHRGEYVVLLSPDVPNFFESNDYDWMKPRPLAGRTATAVEEILPLYPRVPPRRDALLLVARPFEIGTVMAQVEDVYPGAECKLQAHPESSRLDLGACRIPQASLSKPRLE